MTRYHKIAVIGLVALAGFFALRSRGARHDDLVVVAEPLKATAPPPAASINTPVLAPPPPPAATAAAPKIQADETAGKTVDVTEVGTSPADMSSPYLGPKVAPVVVNIFSDFQCPVCKRSADPIKQLVQDFPGKVKVVYRNNALAMHGRSRPAALAAWAAKKQGRFWEYHDLLFSRQALDDATLEGYAQQLTLNMDQWRKDMADPKNAARIDEEADWAKRLGAEGTPSLFVNGGRTVGWASYGGLQAEVQRELAFLQGSTQPLKDRIVAMASKNAAIHPGDPRVDAPLWARLLTHD